MDLTTLANKLKDKDFFKKACPGRFLFTPYWKKAYQKYTTAGETGVCNAVTLRDLTYDERVYRVLAYSTNGDLSADNVAELKDVVNRFDINTLRYEANGTNGFFPLLNSEGEMCRDDYAMTGLCKQMNGIFLMVIAESEDEKDALNCSHVVYTLDNKEMWHWAVADANIR